MEKLKKTEQRINEMIDSLNLKETNDLEKFNILSNLQQMLSKTKLMRM